MSNPVYTDKDLYDASGKPHGSDIAQGALGDCYFIAPLGSLASQQPQTIQRAIHYDAKDQTFGVTLYREGAHHKPEPVTIKVTQADVQGDRAVGVDSNGYWTKSQPAPLWPGVMESAYAKFNAEYANEPIKDELRHIGKGGYASNTIYALTGQHDTTVQASALHDQHKAYSELHQALSDGRSMLLNTNPMKNMPHDGLVKGDWNVADPSKSSGHAYMVEKVYKDAQGEVMLTVRNPWGRNDVPTTGVNSLNPTTEIKLKEVISNGHLQSIDIGPEPAYQLERTPIRDYEQPRSKASLAETLTGDHHIDSMIAALNDPVAFKQAMINLTNSPEGEAFRAEGRAMHAEMRSQQLQQQLNLQQTQAQTPVQQVPVMGR